MNAAQNLDFQAVNSAALANPSYLEKRLPNAHKEGQELVAGDIQGNPGKSFKLNLASGQWADFATDESGGDPVSFVAAQEGIGQGEAARLIADELGISSPAPLARKSKELQECPIDWNNPSRMYPYFYPDGSHAFDVLRWERPGYRKAIRQSKGHDETGKRITNNKGTELVPYNLVGVAGRPAVLDSGFVAVVEGENKADALIDLGICATCNPGGAGKWKAEYAAHFQGKAVVILPDNDRAGKDHAAAVAASLVPVASSVKVVDLPGLPDKGDILDWLKVRGNDAERLRALMNDAPFCKKKEGLVLLDSTELVSLDIKPRGHVFYPIIPEQGLAMLFAPRGIGKTFAAMSIANATAGGGALFGGKGGPTWFADKPRKVLYIDGEMPLHAMKTRQQAIQGGLPFPIPPGNLRYLNPEMQPDFMMPKLSTKAGQQQIDAILDGVELVLIDNITTLCNGSGKENDAESWQPMQEWILQLRRRGVSVLLVHHAGKSGEQRGTSSKEDVLDTVIKLRRPDDYMNEDGARFIVELTKSRGLCGSEANPFEASIRDENGSLTWITKDISNRELEEVRELMKGGKKTVRQIAKELDLSRSKVGRLMQSIREGV